MRDNKPIYYIRTADGQLLAVPKSKLKEFRALNEEIKARMQKDEGEKKDNKQKSGK